MDNIHNADRSIFGLSKAIKDAIGTLEPHFQDGGTKDTYHRNVQRFVLWTSDYGSSEEVLDNFFEYEPELSLA